MGGLHYPAVAIRAIEDMAYEEHNIYLFQWPSDLNAVF
jgi:hypothetical protein